MASGDNAMAGIGGLTQPPFLPGGGFDYRLTPPDSGFNLYLPHAGAATLGQIGRGLYGPIVIEEILAARARFRGDRRSRRLASRADGHVRDVPSIPARRGRTRPPATRVAANNGATPLRSASGAGRRVRLRLANAAARECWAIGVDGARPLIIALDGQPCEAVRAAARRVSDRSGRAFRHDVRHAGRGRRRPFRFAWRRRRAGEADRP